ncbi:thiamine phosphate synthase [Candidatus Poribacteria bacterium]|nr:thiamine phosphate synthase [Candidatus Poribacteria bacterium]
MLHKKLKFPLLYLITSSQLFKNKKDFFNAINLAIRAGIDVIQLREKDFSTLELFNTACKIKEMIGSKNTILIINDRIDIMLASGADGVHLGWKSLSVERTRDLIGSDKIIGISMHSLDEIKNIGNKPIDYLTLSPIFPTPSKKDLLSPLGLETLRNAVKCSSFPIIALGGIDKNNIKDVFKTGASGAAFIRAVLEAEDIIKKVKE